MTPFRSFLGGAHRLIFSADSVSNGKRASVAKWPGLWVGTVNAA